MVLEDMSLSIRLASISSNMALLRSESLMASRAARSAFSACGSTRRDLPARADSDTPSATTKDGLLRARSRAVSALDLRHTAEDPPDSSPKQSSSTDHRTALSPPTDAAGPSSVRCCCCCCNSGAEDARPNTVKLSAKANEITATDGDMVCRWKINSKCPVIRYI